MRKTSFSLKFSTKQLALWGMVLFAVSAHAQLAVNEFNSKRGFTDETGEDVDWIEVFNYATDSVFLADYFLSDNPDNLDKWQFPNTYLGSQELITPSGRLNVIDLAKFIFIHKRDRILWIWLYAFVPNIIPHFT